MVLWFALPSFREIERNICFFFTFKIIFSFNRNCVAILQFSGINNDIFRICRETYIRQYSDCVFEVRSEEHTSELQSRGHLVCRLLLEKKKKTDSTIYVITRK